MHQLSRLVAAAVLASGVLIGRLALAAPPIKMSDVVRRALSNNERARTALMRVQAAEGSVDRARAGFLPSLNFGGSYTAYNSSDAAARAATTTGSLTLSQPIIAPSQWPLYSQAKSTLEAENAGARQDRRSVAFDTARAFLQTLAAEQTLAASKARRDKAQNNLNDSKARGGAGLASSNDATRASVDMFLAERDVATQEVALKRAYFNLSFLAGEEVTGPLEPPDSVAKTDGVVGRGFQPLVDEAASRRPDLREAHYKAEAQATSAKEPHYRLAPTLSAQAQARALVDPPAGTGRAIDETVTLNLSWALFDGGARYGDRKQRLAQAESARLAESLLRRSIGNDIRIATEVFRGAKVAFAKASEAVEASAKNIEETDILYKQGLAKAIELTDANARRYDAELTLVSAKLSLEQATLDLRIALGLDPTDDVATAPPGGSE